MKYLNIDAGQTLFDIALQAYGTTEALFTGLLTDNPTLNLNSNLTPGQVLNIKTPPNSPQVTNYFKARNQKINTGDPQQDTGAEFNTNFSTDFNS